MRDRTYDPVRRACPDVIPSAEHLRQERRPVAFLDRDGVLNIDRGYVHSVEEFEWTVGILEAIRLLNAAEYHVIVVTNQSGIGRGYYPEEDFLRLSRWLLEEADAASASIDAIYYCPHHPDAADDLYRAVCPARKPGTGMLERATLEFDVELAGSFLIGDRESDVDAAEAFGVPGHFFKEGDVLEFVASIVGRKV